MSDKIAVIIKTCIGRPSILWILNSVIYNMKNYNFRLYISDEKPLDKWKESVYSELTDNGHHVELHEAGIGCGVARNIQVQSLQDENLVLKMDDDFELGGEFRLSSLITILNASEEIGFSSDFERQVGYGRVALSGSIRPPGGEYEVSPPILIKNFHGPFRKRRIESDIKYSFAEHTHNLILLKRDVVEKVKWNEELLFQGEHSEFMLSLKEAGYRGVYTPDSIHYHREDLSKYRFKTNSSANYRRRGDAEMKQVYMKKWGCNKVVTKYPMSWYCFEAVRRAVDWMM